MRIHYFQHVAFEGPAQIEKWAKDSGHSLAGTRFFADEKIPDADAYEMLVVMGGPMSADDDRRFAWMRAEKEAIAAAMKKDLKVLGVCLGAQLIARVLGARVYANREKEIGWWPVELNPPKVRQHPLNVLSQRNTVFHWHGDTFDLPKGTALLARSRACENQAFGLGQNVVGLQFHLEIGATHIQSLLRHAADDLTSGGFVQDGNKMLELAATQAPPMHAKLFKFLDEFTS
jgi:GMP synthase-like glutamine amidotransferase